MWCVYSVNRVTAEKDIALGDNRGLRVENEGLKDRLEESGRKLEEVSVFVAQPECCWLVRQGSETLRYIYLRSFLAIGLRQCLRWLVSESSSRLVMPWGNLLWRTHSLRVNCFSLATPETHTTEALAVQDGLGAPPFPRRCETRRQQSRRRIISSVSAVSKLQRRAPRSLAIPAFFYH